MQEDVGKKTLDSPQSRKFYETPVLQVFMLEEQTANLCFPGDDGFGAGGLS